MKIKPDYTKVHRWEVYADQLPVEYTQSVEEGKDIEKYKNLFSAVAEMPLDDSKVEMADILADIVVNAPIKEGYPYNEPSTLDEIRALRPQWQEIKKEISEEELREKLHGAWMGRICGCLLGKPIEGMRTNELIPLLEQSDNYPMHRYIKSTDITQEMRDNYEYFKRPKLSIASCFIDEVSYMPFDDDTNYVVLAQKVIDKYGKNFTPYDMTQEWMFLQPKTSYCTAERVAFVNFVKAIQPPQSAVYHNPYREWIGAQIRGDYFGYINPGKPENAAELAWRDASISHVKNGIYGEMFAAAMLSVAAVTDDIHEIIRGGMAQIPETSRLYESLTRVIDWYDTGVSENECFDRIHKEWDEYTMHGWCHTISNAMIVAASLLYGEGDYGKTICLSVQTGFDTDCNGATVGSVIGMRNGISAIPSEWCDPIHGTLQTTIFGMDKVKVTDLVELTMKHSKL